MQGREDVSDERLLAAYRAMRSGGDIQSGLPPQAAMGQPPHWLRDFLVWLGQQLEFVLRPVTRFLSWLASFLPDIVYVRYAFWGLLALLAALALWMIVGRLREGVWRLPRWRRRRGTEDAIEPDLPDALPVGPIRAWLREADALAAEGRYAEAVHLLLLRSVDDLARRRPDLVRPALTSRDLARAGAIPSRPRALFAQIAAMVERSLFAGQAVDVEDWSRCRQAYDDFARAGIWA